MRRLVMLVLASACTQPGSTNAPPPINPTPYKAHDVDPVAMCKRMQQLHEAKCGLFADIELGPTCTQEVMGSLGDSRSRVTTEQMDVCTSELTTCSDITACIGEIESTTDVRDCADHSDREVSNAVGLPYAAWRDLMKRGFTRFGEVVSSKDKPLELCGVRTENYWLTALTCEDGSHPLANRSAAEQARLGNVGNGGKCGSIIDHYQVRCPEHAYDVYIDGFVCPQPQ